MAGLLGAGQFDRQSKCNRTRYVKPGESVWMHRAESGSWSLRGVVQCGHATCPACGARMCRETATTLGAAMARHLNAGARIHVDDAADAGAASEQQRKLAGVERGHDCWMLTATIPHYDDGAAVDVARLYRAWATFLRSRGWRRFKARWGIVAVVRVLDATHKNIRRPHPHFHVALFPTASWMPKERSSSWDGTVDAIPDAPALGGMFSKADRTRFLDELRGGLTPAWESAVVDAGAPIRDLAQFRTHGLNLQPCEDAGAYFTKWGLAEEVGATSMKADNHLALLDACGAGDNAAGDAYILWRAAVDGRQWVSGLADMCKAIGVTDLDREIFAAEARRKRELQAVEEGRPLVKVAPLQLEIPATLYAVALGLGWQTVIDVVTAAEAAGVADLNASLVDLLTSATRNARQVRGPPS